MMEKHTLSVLVEDKPGVLARVSGLFSRRGFNIASLAVGPTEQAGVSRMTIVVSVEDFPLEQVTKQLNKLVHVIKIVELEPSQSVQRELLLVKVRADGTVRSQVLETVQLFRAKVVDVSPESLTIEATGTADKITALLRMLEPYGIREMVQSGMVAVGRGPRSITATASGERILRCRQARGTRSRNLSTLLDTSRSGDVGSVRRCRRRAGRPTVTGHTPSERTHHPS